MKRLSSLDYLRGLAAFGVMVFHYSMWTYGLFASENFLGRVGLYAVSVFFVISGITLYHVYFDKIGAPSANGLKDFAIKRVFRIFPLLWAMSLVTIVARRNDMCTPLNIFLNFTGLFSLWRWDQSITYGGWSIANELAFYLFFPVFVLLSKRSKLLFTMLCLTLLSIYLWFAFVRTEGIEELGATVNGRASWTDYTNPLNQVIFFLSGYLAGHLFKHISLPRFTGLVLLLAGLLIFIYYPVSGNSMLIISGAARVVFTASCVLICLGFYKTEFGLPVFLHRIFGTLGEISYGLYLAHPLVWFALMVPLGKYFLPLPPAARLAVAFTVSVACAYLLHRLLEKPFMELGRRVSKRVTGNEATIIGK